MDEQQSNVIGLDSQIQPIRVPFNWFSAVRRGMQIRYEFCLMRGDISFGIFKTDHQRYTSSSVTKVSIFATRRRNFVCHALIRSAFRATRQFKVYERLSRRYYAVDIISHLAKAKRAFIVLPEARCFFKPIVAVSLSLYIFLSRPRIFLNSSTTQFRVYVATCGASLRNESAKMLIREVN